ncbi:MAG: Holliday junction resolvase RuvX [Verrucomicrobia bacterium]|nr:Holliday junction resolvase RuvX [Verrucomicrobiota bacterium]MBU6445991.1 Holliday junction resolvase RuvX [Verrucomicrobiota bacterium]MDE3047690.1 Holliday junction resolvase RuvX [Verrucomicrobiota bacterium]
MARIAAIDFGLKRIGLAVSDAKRKIALPVNVVEGGKKALHNIRESLPLKEIDLILIGLPIEMNGKKGAMAAVVEEFAKMLHDALGIPIQLVDERLSSKGADTQLKEISLNRKSRSEKIDMVAAMLLLQTYLDSIA